MTRKIVGWFAVVAGLLLAIHMGYEIYYWTRSGEPGAGPWSEVAVRGFFLLVGVALVVMGLRRLGRRSSGGR
jgi:hypothetical protein